MRFVSYIVLIGAAAVSTGATLAAQGTRSAPPLTLGGLETQGSAGFAYRFIDVHGFEPAYMQLVGLRAGPRLDDFSLLGTAASGGGQVADHFAITADGLGGDPFPTAQFSVSKAGVYDFRADWRQSYYYWNQNDAFVPPGGVPGLTSNQSWATVRKLGNASLTLHASNDLRFNFNIERASNDGSVFLTQAPDFLGSPATWGTFARANPYQLFQPLQDTSNKVTGGFDYTFSGWTLHYSLGYQNFNEAVNAANATSPEFSINTGQASTSTTPLLNFAQSETRQLQGPVSDFSYNTKLTPRLDYRGDYLFFEFSGPARLVQSFNGTAPVNGSGPILAPYSVAENGQAQVSQPQHVLDQGLSYEIAPGWGMDADYRLERFSSQTSGSFFSLYNGTTATVLPEQLNWDNGLQSLDLSMLFTPLPGLQFRPGVRLLRTDIQQEEFGVADPATSLSTHTISPEISVFYKPVEAFSLRGDIHNVDNGSSYTAISPHIQTGGHLLAALRLGSGWSLENDLKMDNSKLVLTGFESRVHANSTALSYSPSSRWSLFGGFTYDSDFAAGEILYARGTPPLNDFLRDQTVNRVIQGGIEAGPFAHFGLSLTGNYVHSSGIGQISGEPPSDGPLTWPVATGTVYVDVPGAGRFSVDLQRTYFAEQIVTGNNFSAALLTLKWSRGF